MKELELKLITAERNLRSAGRAMHAAGLICYESRRYVAAQKLFTLRTQSVEIADKLNMGRKRRKTR